LNGTFQTATSEATKTANYSSRNYYFESWKFEFFVMMTYGNSKVTAIAILKKPKLVLVNRSFINIGKIEMQSIPTIKANCGFFFHFFFLIYCLAIPTPSVVSGFTKTSFLRYL
jgi:hypothetical protein